MPKNIAISSLKKKFYQSGFTLIELLIVIAIIAGLMMLFVNAYPSGGRKARDAQRKSDLKQYQTALESYAFGHDGSYPGASGLIPSLCEQVSLDACPDDPKADPPDDKHYHYSVDGTSRNYFLWAELENNPSEMLNLYFVICSEGVAANCESADTPSGAVCPIGISCTKV